MFYIIYHIGGQIEDRLFAEQLGSGAVATGEAAPVISSIVKEVLSSCLEFPPGEVKSPGSADSAAPSPSAAMRPKMAALVRRLSGTVLGHAERLFANLALLGSGEGAASDGSRGLLTAAAIVSKSPLVPLASIVLHALILLGSRYDHALLRLSRALVYWL